jgi:hypothetical protein
VVWPPRQSGRGSGPPHLGQRPARWRKLVTLAAGLQTVPGGGSPPPSTARQAHTSGVRIGVWPSLGRAGEGPTNSTSARAPRGGGSLPCHQQVYGDRGASSGGSPPLRRSRQAHTSGVRIGVWSPCQSGRGCEPQPPGVGPPGLLEACRAVGAMPCLRCISW